MAEAPVKGKYDRRSTANSAYEMLQQARRRHAGRVPASRQPARRRRRRPADWLARHGRRDCAAIFGTNLTRGQRLCDRPGDRARPSTRSVSSEVAGVGVDRKSLGRRSAAGRPRDRARHAGRNLAQIAAALAAGVCCDTDTSRQYQMTSATEAFPQFSTASTPISIKRSSGCSISCASSRSRPTRPTRTQCRAAAEYVAKDLTSSGSRRRCGRPKGHPVVVGKATATSGSGGPRVLFYGHYDVQPVDPLDLGRRRRSSRASTSCRTAARSSSRAAPATTKAS